VRDYARRRRPALHDQNSPECRLKFREADPVAIVDEDTVKPSIDQNADERKRDDKDKKRHTKSGVRMRQDQGPIDQPNQSQTNQESCQPSQITSHHNLRPSIQSAKNSRPKDPVNHETAAAAIDVALRPIAI
jgi:hypothetical protein